VVLIMDDASVVVPQNLAVAANYECYRCITAAIANQLVLTVESEPGDEQLLALAGVWDRLTEFGKDITSYSLAEISAKLEGFKEEIAEILYDAPPVSDESAGASPSPSASPGEGASDGSSPSSDPSDGTTTSPSASPGPSPSGSGPDPGPSPTPSPSPDTTAPSPSPSPSTETGTTTSPSP
jgi:putative peptide zinc metalloprotease protein